MPEVNSPQNHAYQETLNHLMDCIVDNGHTHNWLREQIGRVEVTVNTLIDSDTFGNMGDFQDNYPDAPNIDKLYILKAMLEGRPYLQYNVQEITAVLRQYMDQYDAFDRAIDGAVYAEQQAQSFRWNISISSNLEEVYSQLVRLFVLKKMQSMQSELNIQDPQMANWIENKLNGGEGDNLIFRAASAYEYFLMGANSYKKFFLNEIALVKNCFNNLKSIFNLAKNLQSPIDLAKNFLKSIWFGLLAMIRVGMIILLPYRLLLTTIQEFSRLTEKLLFLGMKNFFPNITANNPFIVIFGESLKLGLFLGALLTFDIPLLLVFGFAQVPLSWSLGFMAKLTLGFGLTPFTLGLTYGFCETLYNVGHSLIVGADLENQTNISPELRQQLIRALNFEKIAVANNSNLSATEKQEITQKLQEEITELFRNDVPHILTEFDREVLQRQAQRRNAAAQANDEDIEAGQNPSRPIIV